MTGVGLEELADRLARFHQETRSTPFPYEGCRRLLRETPGAHEDLIPDLDLYFSNIAGYCSWGRRILKWPKEKREEAKNGLSLSFVEKYPKYTPLMVRITETSTPDLFREMMLHENIRKELLGIIDRLASQYEQ